MMNDMSTILLKVRILLGGLFLFSGLHAVNPAISDVAASVKYPWDGKVSLSYTVLGDIPAVYSAGGNSVALQIEAIDRANGTNYVATALTGDVGLSAGMHSGIVWDMASQGIDISSTDVVFSVSCVVTPAPYCVVDLTGGHYSVTTLDSVPEGGWSEEYKTSKIVLRRIDPGTFTMGDVRGIHPEDTATPACSGIELTRTFYMGVFETTQRQWELVTGTRPSAFTNSVYAATRPVEKVRYTDIRGTVEGIRWPSSQDVDATSFLGLLRARTGMNSFDLPTEAQWEYACRAGTETDFNNDRNWSMGQEESPMDELGRYIYTAGEESSPSMACDTSQGTASVGCYAPNAWGLYDMHGNVQEWCLDIYAKTLVSNVKDPVGASSGASRVVRGGAWKNYQEACTSQSRSYLRQNMAYNYIGFRLARALETDSQVSPPSGEAPSIYVNIEEKPGVVSVRDDATHPVSYTGVYDGVGHGISIQILEPSSGAIVSYASSPEGPWTPQAPLSTNVIDGAVTYYRIEAEKYETLEGSASVTIVARAISDSMIGTVEPVLYTDTPMEPKPPVRDDELGRDLVEGVDYRLSYEGNDTVGLATVKVVGQGNYCGMCSRTFTILQGAAQPGDIEITGGNPGSSIGGVPAGPDPEDPDGLLLRPESYDGVYDGEGHSVSVVVTKPTTGVRVSYACSPAGPFREMPPVFTNACPPTKVWYIVETERYLPMTNAAAIRIAPRSIDATWVSSPSARVWTGNVIEPEPVVQDPTGKTVPLKDRDYVVSYTDNVRVGTASLTLTGQGNFQGCATVAFSIVPCGIVDVQISQTRFDGQFAQISLTCGIGGARIFYTLDGSTPTDAAALVYNGPFVVEDGTRIRAVAECEGYASGAELDLVVTHETTWGGSGKTTYPKTWKDGAKISVKAQADRGSFFAGWTGVAVEGLSENERRNPSLSLVAPVGFATNQLTATYLPVDLDDLSSLGLSDVSDLMPYTLVTNVWVTHNSRSFVKATVTGLPMGLKFNAQTLEISGIPTKAGTFWVKITASNASGFKWAETVKWVVSGLGAGANEPRIARTRYWPLTVQSVDAKMGTVTGTGVYAEGAKASIKATPVKGFVFAGWYFDRACEIPAAFVSGDFRNPSQSAHVPTHRYLFARFVPKGMETDPVENLTVTGAVPGDSVELVWHVGVSLPSEDPCRVLFDSASLPTVTVSGLPSGVKYDKNSMSFTGVPTKAGTFTPVVTVKNASGAQSRIQMQVTIYDLPAWAQGVFNGGSACGQAQMSISKVGKISGKWLSEGIAYTLTATSFSQVDEGSYVAHVTAAWSGKDAQGKTFKTNEVWQLTVAAGEIGGVAACSRTAESVEFALWQNLWGLAEYKALGKELCGTKGLVLAAAFPAYDLPSGATLSLLVKNTGAVMATGVFDGVKLSGAAVVCPTGPSDAPMFSGKIFVYFPPNAKSGFAGYATMVDIEGWKLSEAVSVQGR